MGIIAPPPSLRA